MALGETDMTLIVMLAPLFWLVVSAQTTEPSCPGALTSLTPCLSFSFTNSSTPSTSCCSELANMLQTAPVCLCNVLNGVGGEVLGGFLSKTLAQALPSACNMQTPPLSQCDGYGLGGQGLGGSQDTGGGAYSEGAVVDIPFLLTIFLTLEASFTLHF